MEIIKTRIRQIEDRIRKEGYYVTDLYHQAMDISVGWFKAYRFGYGEFKEKEVLFLWSKLTDKSKKFCEELEKKANIKIVKEIR